MRDWAGKRYWLLGADTRLGAELARTLSRAGVELVLSGDDQGALEDLMVSLPGRASYIPLDVTRMDKLDGVAIELGGVDGMVYAVDSLLPLRLSDWNAAAAGAMVAENLAGIGNALAVALPAFQERGEGHVVLLDSLAGAIGVPGTLGYGAAKAGVRVLAEAVRAEAQSGRLSVQLVTLGLPSGPFSPTPEQAAAGIFEHMGTDRFRRTVPPLAGALMRVLRVLPDWLARPLVARLTKGAQD